MNHNEILIRMRSAFQIEAADLLNELDSSLLQLEADPADSELINRVFRAIHTLKGSGAMAGFERLSHFAHRVEEVFNAARDGKVHITPELMDIALPSCDLLRTFLADGDTTPGLEAETEKRLVDGLSAFVKPIESVVKAEEPVADQSGHQRLRQIRFIPGARMLFSGSDPVALLAELCELGTAHVTAHVDSLPAFEELDPERCYVWWEIELFSEASEEVIRDVFVFVADDCSIEIEQDNAEELGKLPVRVSPRDFESFYDEADEHILAIEEYLLQLEKSADTTSDFAELFRHLHSLKGACGLLLGESGNLAPQHPLRLLHQMSHAAEGLVQRQRDGESTDAQQMGSTLLEVCPAMRHLLECIDGSQAADIDPSLLKRLGISITALPADAPRDAKLVAFLETASQCLDNMRACFANLQAGEKDPGSIATYQRALRTLDGASNYAGMKNLQAQLREHSTALEVSSATEATVAQAQLLLLQLDRTEQLVNSIRTGNGESDASAPAQNPTSEHRSRTSDTGPQTIRVDQEKLERLVRNVSELLVARGAIRLLARKLDSEYGLRELATEAKEASTSISRISEELQDAVMSMRMLPVKTVFQRFPRLVRDLGRSLGKEMEISLQGEDTELDKAVIQEIGDPLVHLVRNSADHGIESPETREANGKPRCGQITLRAYNEGSQVVIEVEDDGKGLHADVLKAKAVERGIITATEAQSMSDDAACQLIFSPGFSTAEAVTDVSGRGVGMDVVSSNVQKLKGSIAIQSRRGLGTKFVIKLPTSLMISRGLLTKCGDSEFILPLDSVSIARKVAASDIHRYRDHSMINTSEGTCPVITLRQHLGLEELEVEEDEKCIVLMHTSGRRYGLIVDRLLGEEQVVVKPLSGGLEKNTDFLGATIMGDGRVVLVLDPNGVAV
jgi:two-component system chemotaxis sensor kinase CheA